MFNKKKKKIFLIVLEFFFLRRVYILVSSKCIRFDIEILGVCDFFIVLLEIMVLLN